MSIIAVVKFDGAKYVSLEQVSQLIDEMAGLREEIARLREFNKNLEENRRSATALFKTRDEENFEPRKEVESLYSQHNAALEQCVVFKNANHNTALERDSLKVENERLKAAYEKAELRWAERHKHVTALLARARSFLDVIYVEEPQAADGSTPSSRLKKEIDAVLGQEGGDK